MTDDRHIIALLDIKRNTINGFILFVIGVIYIFDFYQTHNIYKVKQKSGAVWNQWTEQMYLKTILHRLCKKIEIDFDNAEQQKYFNEEMEIETDVKAQAANDIAENANKADLNDEDIIEVVVDESTQTIVEDSGQQSFVTEE